MTADTPDTELLNRFKVPPQDLDSLSFCASKPAKVKAWVEELPLTRISYVSSLLYKALPEIGRLKTDPQTRLAMLEAIRPAVQQAIQGLAPQFLNQPLILPAVARKTATVAQALQKHLTNGYLVTLLELEQSNKNASSEPKAGNASSQNNAPSPSKASNQSKTLSIHRAMTGLGLLLLRSYQLYSPVPRRLWLELHTLYQLAEQGQLQQMALAEPLDEEHLITIESNYLRLLLLACSHPNQLRQTEVGATYEALETLAPLAQLVAYDAHQEDNLFAVVLESDSPPLYKSRIPTTPGAIRELDTGPVIQALTEERKSPSARQGSSRDKYGLTTALNEHLTQSWQLLAQRSFERQPGQGQMELTIGLSNLHFHLSGGQPFNLFMNQAANIHQDQGGLFRNQIPTAKPPLQEPDAWGNAFDAGGSRLAGGQIGTYNIETNIRQREQKSYQGTHPVYQVPVVDTSLGGYCLEWREQVPVHLKAGELLGLKEAGRHRWSVGVVRWVQQARSATLIGVQTLAPQATPLGTAVVLKTGGYSEFLRALEIPALKAINQPATLLTNAVTFHEYTKVQLYRRNTGQQEENHKTQRVVQLTRRRFSTGTISQFEYRELAADSEKAPRN